jgi:hypothetical protein
MGHFMATRNRHKQFALYGKTTVMQLDQPVRVTSESVYFVVDKAGVDISVKKSADGWVMTVDMLEPAFRVSVGMCGKQINITKTSTLTTAMPIFELVCRRVVGCVATLSSNTKRALEASIKLVPEYATVWAATASSTTLFLVTEHPRGGWVCDSCGTEYDLLKSLCEHLRAPNYAKFRRVSKSGLIDGICPPPSNKRKIIDPPRWVFAINSNALRKKIKEIKPTKATTLVQKLTLAPRFK